MRRKIKLQTSCVVAPVRRLISLLVLLLCYFTSIGQDTLKLTGKSFDSSAFAADDTLTHSDYLLHIGRAFQTLNQAPLVAQFVSAIKVMKSQLDEDDSAVKIIKNRLAATDHGVDVRNLQMFIILIDQMSADNEAYAKRVNGFDSTLDGIKQSIYLIKKDTAILKMLKFRSLREEFTSELIEFHDKWENADTIIKHANVLIDQTLARLSGNKISLEELQRHADELLLSTGPRIFGKERRYLWEPRPVVRPASDSLDMANIMSDEKKITIFYFKHSRDQMYLLLLTALIFFYWIYHNFRSIRRLGKLSGLHQLHLKYVSPLPVIVTIIFLLNLAPLFDLNAPVIYIQSVEFLLMTALTVFFIKQLSSKMLYLCAAFILLFILLSVTRFTGLAFYMQRWWTLCINAASCAVGLMILSVLRKKFSKQKVVYFITILFTLLNFIAVLCNLFGRVTLTQILGSTAYTAFIQVISLIVFVHLIKEAFLLQIQSSRLRKNYPEDFDSLSIEKGISKIVTVLACIIWLIVFFTNLNLYDVLHDRIMDFLIMQRKLGSIYFSISGVLLFLLIIWLANFLQKYIAYFFGDIGDDAAFENKGPRSKLLITRLIMLVAGFLLAVAASGLPLDKITVIIGALGIGIGLGLQNIVNNFVSGIILIFDRPLRIGDTVEIGDKKGRVKEISVRSSTLLTAEGAEVIIPNGDILSHNIVNWTLSNNYIRVELTFTIDQLFTDDITAPVKEVIEAVPGVLAQKAPEILIRAVASKSVEMKIYFWCKDVSKMEEVRSDVYAAVYKYLKSRNLYAE